MFVARVKEMFMTAKTKVVEFKDAKMKPSTNTDGSPKEPGRFKKAVQNDKVVHSTKKIFGNFRVRMTAYLLVVALGVYLLNTVFQTLPGLVVALVVIITVTFVQDWWLKRPGRALQDDTDTAPGSVPA